MRMKTKATILNCIAIIGVITAFYLAWVSDSDVRSFELGESLSPAPQDDPISHALGYLFSVASIASSILYGLLLSAIVLIVCSAAAIALKLKIVATGYGIAFDVSRNEVSGIEKTNKATKK